MSGEMSGEMAGAPPTRAGGPTVAGDLAAIDCHVHLRDAGSRASSEARQRHAQMAAFVGQTATTVAVEELADQYRSRRMMAVLVNTTDVTVTGRHGATNDHIAEVVRSHPDVFLGFGIVDPWMGKLAVEEIRRCQEELGLVGVGEFNPARQHFYANDPRFYPLWDAAQGLGMPVMFHSGMAVAGAGTAGGAGVKLKYTRPIPYFDDVAADFPDLTIIGAHPSWPYEAEGLAVALHKSNYFMDLSGWAPKYLSDEVVRQVRSRLQDKVMFGSDNGIIPLDRWLQEFGELPIPEVVKKKILLYNAARVLGIDLDRGEPVTPAGDGEVTARG